MGALRQVKLIERKMVRFLGQVELVKKGRCGFIRHDVKLVGKTMGIP